MLLGDRWRDADASEALKLQSPGSDDAVDIVARGEKEDRGSPPSGATRRRQR